MDLHRHLHQPLHRHLQADDVVALTLLFAIWVFVVLSECKRQSRPRRVYIHFFVQGRRVRKHMQLKVNDQLPISIQAADEFGNPTTANFDAPPVWTSSDDTVASVQASADGLSALVTSPSGKLASATVQVSGTVGGSPVQGSLQLDMVAGDTAEIVLAPGTPVAVAPAAPAPATPAPDAPVSAPTA